MSPWYSSILETIVYIVSDMFVVVRSLIFSDFSVFDSISSYYFMSPFLLSFL